MTESKLPRMRAFKPMRTPTDAPSVRKIVSGFAFTLHIPLLFQEITGPCKQTSEPAILLAQQQCTVEDSISCTDVLDFKPMRRICGFGCENREYRRYSIILNLIVLDKLYRLRSAA
jgi:hypothetical protein